MHLNTLTVLWSWTQSTKVVTLAFLVFFFYKYSVIVCDQYVFTKYLSV